MRNDSSGELYVNFRNKLFNMILNGEFKEDDYLPSERILSAQYNVSRVTIRKSINLLEEEKLIIREQGKGNKVVYRKDGYSGPLDMITLIGSVSTPFFSTFMEAFESYAERNDALVVFKRYKSRYSSYKNLINKLIKVGIRNMVLWPHHHEIDSKALSSARGVGCNLVFFDQLVEGSVADCLLLDNKHAISSLFKYFVDLGLSNFEYVGWSNLPVSSTLEREGAFEKICNGKIHKLTWSPEFVINVSDIVKKIIKTKPDGIICGNGDIAIAIKKALLENTGDLKLTPVVSVDYKDEMKNLSITCYEQPMDKFGKAAFELLKNQSRIEMDWQPSIVRLKGKIIKH